MQHKNGTLCMLACAGSTSVHEWMYRVMVRPKDKCIAVYQSFEYKCIYFFSILLDQDYNSMICINDGVMIITHSAVLALNKICWILLFIMSLFFPVWASYFLVKVHYSCYLRSLPEKSSRREKKLKTCI